MTRRLRPEGPAGRRRAPGLALAAALTAALWAPVSLALESDRQAPASIEADRVEIDRASGISRYIGDVVFTQGSLRITGDRLTLEAPAGEVQKAEVHGQRATIRQQTANGQTVRARARHIIYDAAQGAATLTGNAELLRDGDRFAAGRIEYRPDSGRIDAAGGDDGERVRIRIEPEGGDNAAGDSGGDGSDQTQ